MAPTKILFKCTFRTILSDYTIFHTVIYFSSSKCIPVVRQEAFKPKYMEEYQSYLVYHEFGPLWSLISSLLMCLET